MAFKIKDKTPFTIVKGPSTLSFSSHQFVNLTTKLTGFSLAICYILVGETHENNFKWFEFNSKSWILTSLLSIQTIENFNKKSKIVK